MSIRHFCCVLLLLSTSAMAHAQTQAYWPLDTWISPLARWSSELQGATDRLAADVAGLDRSWPVRDREMWRFLKTHSSGNTQSY